MVTKHARISVSKQGTIQLHVLIEDVWKGVLLDDGEADAIIEMLENAKKRAHHD